ncbi:ATP-binding cassette domain-containing protein [Mesomycoplasma neurolyticum]|uniref:ABC transporter ATP-binding protein n=1 Tax=Mesomycoplasma neurolyticum TaxID=2120 RepID=A0A449A5J5_9BACT|nr:ATP-binding cassette domain-containing protein [Mesomycoplasma neurolyticum]VEU59531.1 ABC transporter ATP-binding protein [Mesomycoplasma neurolyticum]
MKKIILKNNFSYLILFIFLLLGFLSFASIYFQLEVIKILFNFSEKNILKFILFQLLSLFLEVAYKAFKSLTNILIKKQANNFLLFKKEQIFNSIKNYSPKDLKRKSTTEYIFDLEINLNKYIFDYLDLFYDIVWNIIIFKFLFIFIIIQSVLLSPWVLLFLLFVCICLIFSVILPIISTNKNKKNNSIFLEIQEKNLSYFTNLIQNFQTFYWFNKINIFKNKTYSSLEKINYEQLKVYNKKNIFVFYENFINGFLEQLNLLTISITTLLNPINKLIVSISENIFSTLKMSSQEVINDFKDLKLTNSIKERVGNFEINKFEVLSEKKDINKINISNLNLTFNNKNIFTNFNVEFNKNKSYLIDGKSGVGKSSLIKIILNEIDETKYSGILKFNNKKVSKNDFNNMYKQLIYLTNEENKYNTSAINVITLFDENIDYSKIEKAKKLACINFDLNQNFDLLSTGQKQRVKIARLFYFNKKIIILDEALSGIDNIKKIEILQKILSLQNKIIIFISHHLIKEEKDLFNYTIHIK